MSEIFVSSLRQEMVCIWNPGRRLIKLRVLGAGEADGSDIIASVESAMPPVPSTEDMYRKTARLAEEARIMVI